MDKCHKLYKWIMLHAVGDVSLLSLFREKVKAHFQAKADATACPRERHACRSRMTMALYKKGDTRMLSIFKQQQLGHFDATIYGTAGLFIATRRRPTWPPHGGPAAPWLAKIVR